MMADDLRVIDGRQVRILSEADDAFADAVQRQHVFIVGSKGIPASYGGFETFVEELTGRKLSEKLLYHVARMGDRRFRFEYNGAQCFNVKVPNIGPAKAVYYDLAALQHCIDYCKASPEIAQPIFYVLACRIGPFIQFYKKQIQALGGLLYINPDGHEWKRAKWSAPVRRYWKLSERLMVKHADLLICDSRNIEKYIQESYAKYHPNTTFIAYGSSYQPSEMSDDDAKLTAWYEEKGLSKNSYYLAVGRFVPENNYETMIREFMASATRRDLAIITTENAKYMAELEEKLHMSEDPRIKFVGTVYDQELLKKIRENAYGYLHGHEVGGTNPSLLEALGSTKLNLLLGVGFNREVGEDAAVYWTKAEGNLARLLEKADAIEQRTVEAYGRRAKKRIKEAYSWEFIVEEYEKLFLKK